MTTPTRSVVDDPIPPFGSMPSSPEPASLRSEEEPRDDLFVVFSGIGLFCAGMLAFYLYPILAMPS